MKCWGIRTFVHTEEPLNREFQDMTTTPQVEPANRPQWHAPPVGEIRVLDSDALAKLALMDPTGSNQLIARVLKTYSGSLARLLAQLVAGRQPFDPVALTLSTHTLKSSSASVGALELSALCGSAESALRDGRFDLLPAILDDLEIEAGRVGLAIHQQLLLK